MQINILYNEECLEGMNRIDDHSIDMVLCDLPYGTTACKWDSIIPFDSLWKQYKRVIKRNGAIVLTASQPFTSITVCSNIQNFKYDWTWKKSRPTNVLNAKIQPTRIKEDVLVFSYGNCVYYPQGLISVNKHVGTGGTKANQQGNATGKIKQTESGTYLQTQTNYPRNVIEFSSLSNTIHPTQKPVALFEYLIRTYTNENEIVLDNCMGSGTTAIACMNTNRNYIGYELDAHYYQVAQKRIQEHATK